jgi:flagellar motility protein MotE (MotC chaperone)
MDDKVLLDIAKSMKPANLASVMSLMAPKRAEALTRMLAQLATPPAGAANPPTDPPKTPV